MITLIKYHDAYKICRGMRVLFVIFDLQVADEVLERFLHGISENEIEIENVNYNYLECN